MKLIEKHIHNIKFKVFRVHVFFCFVSIPFFLFLCLLILLSQSENAISNRFTNCHFLVFFVLFDFCLAKIFFLYLFTVELFCNSFFNCRAHLLWKQTKKWIRYLKIFWWVPVSGSGSKTADISNKTNNELDDVFRLSLLSFS